MSCKDLETSKQTSIKSTKSRVGHPIFQDMWWLVLILLLLIRCKFEFSKYPRQLYNFVNAKRKSPALPSSVRLNSIEASMDPEITDLFAEFFQSTYSSVSWSNSSYPNHLNSANCIFSPVITESSLLSDLETILPTYSPGPDGLPG